MLVLGAQLKQLICVTGELDFLPGFAQVDMPISKEEQYWRDMWQMSKSALDPQTGERQRMRSNIFDKEANPQQKNVYIVGSME